MARIMRTRPIFNDWSAVIHLDFEDSILNESDVVDFATKAGAVVGVGDWRPRYGRFEVVC